MPSKTCTDHMGNVYASQTEMTLAWGTDPRTYLSRRRRGWSLKMALTEENSRVNLVRDHEGNAFKTIAEMARFWGQGGDLVAWRLRHGWNVRDALLTEKGIHAHACTDLNGRIFSSINKMCDANFISPSSYYKKKRNGMTLEQILR